MVEWKADFLLLFEGNRTGKKKEFLELLKNWGERITIGKETEYGVEVLMKHKEAEDSALPFYLLAAPDAIRGISGLYFYTDSMSDSYPSEQELFYDIFLTVCKELKPIFGSAQSTEWGTDRESTRPCTDQAEYYQNPYLFCVEPPLSDYYFNDSSYINAFYDFLHSNELTTKLVEIERVVSRSELVGIIQQHVGEMIESDDGGIGVLKNNVQAVYPRYFIRQELRRRGIQIEEGLAEQYAKEFKVDLKE